MWGGGDAHDAVQQGIRTIYLFVQAPIMMKRNVDEIKYTTNYDIDDSFDKVQAERTAIYIIE